MDHDDKQVAYEEVVRLCTSDLRRIQGKLKRVATRKGFNGFTIDDFQEINAIATSIVSLKKLVDELLQREMRNTGDWYDEYLAEHFDDEDGV